MEPRRELTGVDLRALVGELAALREAAVRKAYLYPGGLIRLRLRDRDHERRELLVEIGEHMRVTDADPDRVPAAPDRPPNFAMMLRNRLEGARIQAITQYEFDRIVEIECDRDDESTTLIAELFGDGNFVVVSPDGTVVDCLREVQLKSRRVVPGEPYEYPESRIDPFIVDRDELNSRLLDSSSDVVRTLATQLNLGGLWGEEICTRADVPKNLDVEELEPAMIDRLHAELTAIDDRLANADLDPGIYAADETPIGPAPLPLQEWEHLDREPTGTFNEAVDRHFHALVTAEPSEGTTEDRTDEIEADIAEYERIIEHQERAVDDFETEAAAHREQAEALYREYDLVDQVIETIQTALADGYDWTEIAERLGDADAEAVPAAAAIADVDQGNEQVVLALDDHRISVDPHTGVEQNANRLYEEAKAIEEKRDGALEAIEETRADLETAKKRLTAENDPTEADTATDTPTDWLARSTIPIKRSDAWFEQFRWFHTSDGYLVIGGRTAEQNEAIVDKYLEPGDRFFHAQAHGGPVTVLKATGPSEPAKAVDFPDQTLTEAAQFAVSYSSVWKASQFSGDAYMVSPDQVTKDPASGEYLETGAFAIKGDRQYFRNVAVGVAIGVQCEPVTRVVGGPPASIEHTAACAFRLEPGRLAPPDIAKRLYREFREAFTDTTFVRDVAGTDELQRFVPPGGSRILDD